MLRPLSPETGYHFFEGGGGVKSFRSEGSKQWGSLSVSRNRRSNGNAADAKFFGRWFESWSADSWRRRRRRIQPTGVRTAYRKDSGQQHYHSATDSPKVKGLPTAWGRVCH